LAYISYLQSTGIQAVTINIRLQSLDHYYTYLRRSDNPARGLRLKGIRRRALPEVLTPQQLEEVFQWYLQQAPSASARKPQAWTHQRNTVVLSLMIYQGLHGAELFRLRLADVDLTQATLYIASSKRGNQRTLKLQTIQLLLLREYLQQTREKLLTWKGLQTDKLLDVSNRIAAHNIVNGLINALRKQSWVQSAWQLRVSVVVHWLKQYDLRIVQHMIGHRQVSTTQRYQDQDLEDLQQQLTKYHPMK
jgi:integrase/recombinase XerD